MNFLAIFFAVSAAFVGFIYYAMNECKSFTIDYSNAASKIIVITGANSGLGYQTALELAKAKAHVVMACRNAGRCNKAKNDILAVVPDATVTTLELDLGSLASVRHFAAVVKEQFDHVDVLINNAGIMANPTREVTVDGLESQVGTNHFGHFLLTALLYPILAPNARIINHSSEAHRFATSNFPFEDLQSEVKYDPWVAYGNSKLANLLFTYALNERLAASGNPKHIVSIAVHPGYTATNLQKDRVPFYEMMNSFLAMDVKDGALSQLYAAVDPQASASVNTYLGPRFSMLGKPAVQVTSAMAAKKEAQDQLWEVSEQLTGTAFAL